MWFVNTVSWLVNVIGQYWQYWSTLFSVPGVVVVLVDQVLPGDQLEHEHPGADERGDDGPAADEEVARVVSNHVVQGQAEPSTQNLKSNIPII